MASTHVITAKDVDVFYGDKQALDKINLDIPQNRVTALIGPSGCGKTTFLRCINRMISYYALVNCEYSAGVELRCRHQCSAVRCR